VWWYLDYCAPQWCKSGQRHIARDELIGRIWFCDKGPRRWGRYCNKIATVKYDEVFGGVVHSKIPFPVLTVADWECKDLESNIWLGKSPRSPTTIPVASLPEPKKWHLQSQQHAKKEPLVDKLEAFEGRVLEN
jgi:hypothetical protein